MNKPVAILSVAVVLGVAIAGYRWQRTELDAVPAAGAPPHAARLVPSAAPQPRAAPPAVEAPATNTPVVDRDTDERSPFGHGSGQGDVEPQLSTSPAYPERGSDADGTSLAPALADTRATLEQLLAEAGPEALGEVAALGDTRAALEGLLEDPDPAVREQVAALLEVLGSAAPQ